MGWSFDLSVRHCSRHLLPHPLQSQHNADSHPLPTNNFPYLNNLISLSQLWAFESRFRNSGKLFLTSVNLSAFPTRRIMSVNQIPNHLHRRAKPLKNILSTADRDHKCPVPNEPCVILTFHILTVHGKPRRRDTQVLRGEPLEPRNSTSIDRQISLGTPLKGSSSIIPPDGYDFGRKSSPPGPCLNRISTS